MRQDEVEYWDIQASKKINPSFDNIQKKGVLLEKIIRDGDLLYQNILEIGIGLGNIIKALKIIYFSNFNYVATDVSKLYVDNALKFVENIFHTDICKLPRIKHGFTRIICLDSLEHIKPEDRDQGFSEINMAMAEHCRILINLPCDEYKHDKQFDHTFGLNEINQLADATGTDLVLLEKYSVMCVNTLIFSKWVILER
jgi:hypothetical protein